MRIHPIFGHWPQFYKFLPDGNLSLENEDMSGKMRTYGRPIRIRSSRYKTAASTYNDNFTWQVNK